MTSPKLSLRELDNTVRLRFKSKPHPFVQEVIQAAGFEPLWTVIATNANGCTVEYVFSAPWTDRALELARELEA